VKRLFLCLVTAGAIGGSALASGAVADQIESRLDQLMDSGRLVVGGESIAATTLLPELYVARDFAPLWQRGDALEQIETLVEWALAEGLNDADYPIDALRRLDARGRRAAFDLLATETLARVAYHLRFGRVDPEALTARWRFERALQSNVSAAGTLASVAAAPSVAKALRKFAPRGQVMSDLIDALAEHRTLEAAGGWPSVSQGATLRPGDVGPRVAELRARLSVTDAPISSDDEAMFDQSLRDAVVRFQSRHGLFADGLVGRATLRALNVPVSHRIEQLRLSLERGRWVIGDIPESFVLVNVAGFRAAFIDGRKLVWEARVQVGKAFQPTPQFRDDISYLQLNPTWTVPPGIFVRDVLPAIRRDRSYLARNDMVVLGTDGGVVDVEQVDWTAASLPYVIRQRPGPNNALGRIKFVFPNAHQVFLHDTPNRQLFARARRDFSNGCIRIERPLELAALLLRDPERWTVATLEQAIATGETQTIRLEPEVPIYLMYLTALVQEDRVHFYEDIYDRDGPLAAALNAGIER